MKTKKGFGVFCYDEDDNCFRQDYFTKETKAIEFAEEFTNWLEKGQYLEVWEKRKRILGSKW